MVGCEKHGKITRAQFFEWGVVLFTMLDTRLYSARFPTVVEGGVNNFLDTPHIAG